MSDIQLIDYTIFDLLVEKRVSFALYRLPQEEEPTLIIGRTDNNAHLQQISDLNSLSGFVFSPFNINTSTPLILIDVEEMVTGEVLLLEAASNLSKLNLSNLICDNTSVQPDLNSFDRYQENFHVFHSALQSGDLKKIVLSRTAEYSRPSDFSIGNIFQKAINKYKNAFVYVCHTPQTGTWFGCSPEILLKGEGRRWQTVALAGTKYAESGEESLVWDEKNKNEQDIVAEYMEQCLRSQHLAYTKSQPHAIQAGNLVHLESTFDFEMMQNQAGDLLQTLHPTPAVCGFPKKEAYNFILQNEKYERCYYAGFLGPLNLDHSTHLYVNLRCMEVKKDYLKLYAGGGLLPSSDLMDEWLETEYKQQTLLSIIN